MQIKRLLTAVLVLVCLVGGAAYGDRAEARYEAQWGERERAARTPDARNALAEELLNAIDTASGKQMKVLLAKKAFEAGSRDLGGYASAARALDKLQRIAPEERMWALDKLKFLYEAAYRIAPSNAGLARGLASTLEELARQRIEEADLSFETAQADAMTTTKEFRLALRDMRIAESTIQRLIRRVEGDARRLASVAPDRAREYASFARSLEPERRRLANEAAKVQADVKFWTNLVVAERRFKARPDAESAKAVAEVYLAELNQPEMIDQAVLEKLPADYQQAVVRSCVPVDQLNGNAAAALADFYETMAKSASDTSAKQAMFVRARLYHERANTQGVEASRTAMGNVDMMLNASGITASTITERTKALNNRLAYQFKGQRDTQAASTGTASGENAETETSATNTNTPPTDSTPTTTDTSTTPRTTTTATNTSTTPIEVPKATSRTARPMVTCITCGRRFFPGWGADTDANHQCDSCTNGRGSIFDLGD